MAARRRAPQRLLGLSDATAEPVFPRRGELARRYAEAVGREGGDAGLLIDQPDLDPTRLWPKSVASCRTVPVKAEDDSEV